MKSQRYALCPEDMTWLRPRKASQSQIAKIPDYSITEAVF